jgi:hypothetical protein
MALPHDSLAMGQVDPKSMTLGVSTGAPREKIHFLEGAYMVKIILFSKEKGLLTGVLCIPLTTHIRLTEAEYLFLPLITAVHF